MEGKWWSIVPTLVVLLALQGGRAKAQFFVGFYDTKCPRAESLISLTVQQAVARDPTLAASILRMLFHDCWVQVIILFLPSGTMHNIKCFIFSLQETEGPSIQNESLSFARGICCIIIFFSGMVGGMIHITLAGK